MALCAFIFVTVCMHGDDSARATQFILVFDGDDASFLLVLSVRTPTSMVFLFTLTRTRARHGQKHHIHLESAIRVEGLLFSSPANLANISSNEAVCCKN